MANDERKQKDSPSSSPETSLNARVHTPTPPPLGNQSPTDTSSRSNTPTPPSLKEKKEKKPEQPPVHQFFNYGTWALYVKTYKSDKGETKVDRFKIPYGSRFNELTRETYELFAYKKLSTVPRGMTAIGLQKTTTVSQRLQTVARDLRLPSLYGTDLFDLNKSDPHFQKNMLHALAGMGLKRNGIAVVGNIIPPLYNAIASDTVSVRSVNIPYPYATPTKWWNPEPSKNNAYYVNSILKAIVNFSDLAIRNLFGLRVIHRALNFYVFPGIAKGFEVAATNIGKINFLLFKFAKDENNNPLLRAGAVFLGTIFGGFLSQGLSSLLGLQNIIDGKDERGLPKKYSRLKRAGARIAQFIFELIDIPLLISRACSVVADIFRNTARLFDGAATLVNSIGKLIGLGLIKEGILSLWEGREFNANKFKLYGWRILNSIGAIITSGIKLAPAALLALSYAVGIGPVLTPIFQGIGDKLGAFFQYVTSYGPGIKEGFLALGKFLLGVVTSNAILSGYKIFEGIISQAGTKLHELFRGAEMNAFSTMGGEQELAVLSPTSSPAPASPSKSHSESPRSSQSDGRAVTPTPPLDHATPEHSALVVPPTALSPDHVGSTDAKVASALTEAHDEHAALVVVPPVTPQQPSAGATTNPVATDPNAEALSRVAAVVRDDSASAARDAAAHPATNSAGFANNLASAADSSGQGQAATAATPPNPDTKPPGSHTPS